MKKAGGYKMKPVVLPTFEKVEELTLTSDFQRCGTCGAFIRDGLGCSHMFPNGKCWFPKGAIPVSGEKEEGNG